MQNVCLILLSFSFVGLVISCQPQDNAQYVARATVTSDSGHAEGDLDLFPFLSHQEALKYRGWEGWPDSAWSVTLSEGLDLYFQKPYAFRMNRDTLVVEEFVGEYIQGQDFWLEVDPYRYDSTWITFMVEETVHENFDFHQVPKSEESHDTKTLRERYEAFERCFERAFYSFDMGLRKPDPAIYAAVDRELGITSPAEVLFVDDNAANIASAADLRMADAAFCVEPNT